jgi:hypothetical protein
VSVFVPVFGLVLVNVCVWLFPYAFVCVGLCVGLRVGLSVCTCACLRILWVLRVMRVEPFCVCAKYGQSIIPGVCVYVCVCMYLCPSVCQSVCVCLSVCLYIRPSCLCVCVCIGHIRQKPRMGSTRGTSPNAHQSMFVLISQMGCSTSSFTAVLYGATHTTSSQARIKHIC